MNRLSRTILKEIRKTTNNSSALLHEPIFLGKENKYLNEKVIIIIIKSNDTCFDIDILLYI